jgi:Flp pilus assembly protein TadG
MQRNVPSRVRRGQRGKSLIETALVMVIVLTVMFWVFELCWLIYTYSVIADAANEGVRYAIVRSGGDVDGTKARVKSFAGATMHDVTAISTTVEFPDGSAAPPNRVRVTVHYAYIPYLGHFMSTPTMRAYAEGAMVVQLQ